ALASIKAELQKRQRLFGEHDVNHINQYQKLFKQGKATEPMPHLFLISDEFAELKSEQPEFMKELVSTARIGRSLGIHLILATQKPSGVVDDQIWSNSKFKLALKVQNASDSNEILKTPDAAEITLPGRSYLQVGNNEIYELFQSAWSGADYVPDKESTDNIDTTIYAINDLGQYDILTEDLSGLDKKDDLTKLPSE
ncbi:FtsK/SpoIIIE domain-containing protein, partial [Listeria seeligeri]|nr:type VII secretion protein EssC [Listeria seeligeri]